MGCQTDQIVIWGKNEIWADFDTLTSLVVTYLAGIMFLTCIICQYKYISKSGCVYFELFWSVLAKFRHWFFPNFKTLRL